jgi:hypothetical protein
MQERCKTGRSKVDERIKNEVCTGIMEEGITR